jgi:Na+:H+ antiporter, NhaA family
MTERPRTLVRLLFDRFLLLPIGAVIALVWANTASESYFVFAHRLAFAVNEIGMAFFFALVAQEVAEAMMPGGALHTWRRWSLAILAAIGGMAGAVATYLVWLRLAYHYPMIPAWPAALAIDAAVAYYVLKTIMPRRSGAVPFALLVALITDAIAIIVVAPKYLTIETHAGGAALMLAALGLAAAMRALKVRRFWPYLFFCGALSWLAFYWEGLHPAFALIPIVPFLPHEPRSYDVFADTKDDDQVHHAEHAWHVIVQPVLFLFALVNAGVILKDYDTGTWAMLVAGLVGRPAGILIAVGIGLAAGLHLPNRMGWRELVVVAFATSVGFAIALFLATGVLATGPVLSEAKLGVLGSVVGVLIAFAAARLLKVGRLAHQH